MAVIIKGMKPTGCFDCDYCDKRACFDGNEWHLGCRLLCMEVSDDGETDERCPIIGEIPDKHGRIVDISKVEDFLTKWENGELDYEPYLDEVLSMIRYSTKTIVEATE